VKVNRVAVWSRLLTLLKISDFEQEYPTCLSTIQPTVDIHKILTTKSILTDHENLSSGYAIASFTVPDGKIWYLYQAFFTDNQEGTGLRDIALSKGSDYIVILRDDNVGLRSTSAALGFPVTQGWAVVMTITLSGTISASADFSLILEEYDEVQEI